MNKVIHKTNNLDSVGEHLLTILSNIHDSSYCPQTEDPIENFFILTNQHLFMIFSYSVLLAIWVLIASIGLAAKFTQLSDNLFKFKDMRMPAMYWSTRRKQYRNLCELCTRIDGAISLITVISFSNNLYFICMQLPRSLK
ncbi:gustatory receptor for sugar taste 64f-like [Bactrocera dorsalis]|uniref:Gustatory receptor for sugar taste 64f-like n=1 Tax=Bactrocera dorsalis TaxID=27457 RepID=A0ABM3K176_BACDO|nr:gustatory receptor for sugar taste 64f-like [Bactrocera dorsalis]